MVVDKLGLHCVVISDHELYYMNWSDSRVHKMSAIKDESINGPQSRYLVDDQPCNITAVDISLEPYEDSLFDIVFGTQDGRIYHA